MNIKTILQVDIIKELKLLLLFYFFFQSQSLSAQVFSPLDSNNRWGIANSHNSFVIQPEYDSIKEYWNEALGSSYPFFVLFKNNKRGLIIPDFDYCRDSTGIKPKHTLLLAFQIEYDSFKIAHYIVFAYKKNQMAVYSFFGTLLLPFDSIRKCCMISSLESPNVAVLKSPIVYGNESVCDHSTGIEYPIQTSESIDAMRKEIDKKKKEVERKHKRDNRYADYNDNLLVYGNKYYRINYSEWPKKATSVSEVKLSKIMKEEVDWCIHDFCTTQFDQQNSY